MAQLDEEDELLRAVALRNASSILLARQRAEEELLRTKEALRESQERLTAALTAAGTGTFRWNIQANTVEWDGNLDRLFGFPRDHTTQSLEAFVAPVHPDDRVAVREGYQRCAHDGSDFDMEFRVVWPDGRVRWIHERAKAFFDEHGAPLSITGACADVTRRKEIEEALRDNEQRLRAIFNQAAVGIAVAALDGYFVDVNRKFSDILGYTADELRNRTFADITHRDDLPATLAAVRNLLSGAVPEYAMEERYVRKDGSEIWSLTTVTLQKDAEGKAQCFIGVIEDITPRKKAETALREETRILELLNATGKTLASKLDVRSLVQTVTHAATQLSGAQVGAFFFQTTEGDGDAFLVSPPPGVSGVAAAAFDMPRATALLGPMFRGDAPVRHADASQLGDRTMPLGSYMALPVVSRSGELIGSLAFGHTAPDVFTERAERLLVGVAAQAGIAIDNARLYEGAQKAAEERKTLLDSERAARSAAERLSDIKDQFLATLSHELRTPLNAILGWSQVLRNAQGSELDYRKGLETIERNARVQTQLIEDLLDMSRIASGKLRLDIQTLQPGSFVEAAVETVRPAADAKGIRLEILIDPSAGPICGDPGRLQQVVWNVLSNAIKFTPKEGKVQILVKRVNSQIEITVADTGVGIKEEMIPHLFERFRQGDASTTRKYGGLGLGLSIVKSLVELHGGTVSVRSAGDGRGTTVTVQLPLAIAHHNADLRERIHSRSAQIGVTTFIPAELAGLTVLVVDDQPDARDLLKRVLQDCGAEVLTAAGADEAVRLVAEHKPAVLVSDIGMPDVDGYELLKRVRALGSTNGGRVPAIALTALARSEDRTRALRAGFLVHVSKPVDPSELVATVASVAGRVGDRS